MGLVARRRLAVLVPWIALVAVTIFALYQIGARRQEPTAPSVAAPKVDPAAAELARVKAEVQRCLGAAQAAEKALDEALVDLEGARARVADLEREARAARERGEKTEATLAVTKARVVALMPQLEDAQATRAKVDQALARVRSEHATLQAKLAETHEARALLAAQLEDGRAALAMAHADRGALRRQLAESEGARVDVETELETVRQQLDVVQATFAENAQALTRRQAEWKMQGDELQAHVARLQAELAQVHDHATKALDEGEARHRRLVELEKALEQERQARAALEDERRAVQAAFRQPNLGIAEAAAKLMKAYEEAKAALQQEQEARAADHDQVMEETAKDHARYAKASLEIAEQKQKLAVAEEWLAAVTADLAAEQARHVEDVARLQHELEAVHARQEALRLEAVAGREKATLTKDRLAQLLAQRKEEQARHTADVAQLHQELSRVNEALETQRLLRERHEQDLAVAHAALAAAKDPVHDWLEEAASEDMFRLAHAMELVSQATPEQIAHLAELLRDEEASARAAGARLLPALPVGEATDALATELLLAADADPERVRIAGGSLLARPAVLDALLAAAAPAVLDEAVRRLAGRAAGLGAEDRTRMAKAIGTRLEAVASTVEIAVLARTVAVFRLPGVAGRVAAWLGHDDAAVRSASAHALSRVPDLASVRDEAIRALPGLLLDEGRTVRVAGHLLAEALLGEPYPDYDPDAGEAARKAALDRLLDKMA